jgi:formiminoglutamase
LGTIDVTNEMAEVTNLDFNDIDDRSKLSQLVEKIDKEVSHIIFHITKLGKTPIIIGGGQNNAYGNIKGTALANGKPINAINFDAHSDFRILEGRHNGNAFSYAFEEGFLKKYFVFGLHENHVTKSVLDSFKKLEDRLQYVTYDSIRIRKEKDFEEEMLQASEFITQEPFGLEIDLGAIPNIASSTMTLTGFSIEELRHFVSYFGQFKNATYLHLCEGAPELGEEKNDHLIGKIIGHLITDFIKSNNEKIIPQPEEELPI